MTRLEQIQNLIPRSHSVSDLAQQLHMTTRELRRWLISHGYPTDFAWLQSELGDYSSQSKLGTTPEESILLDGYGLLELAEQAKLSPSVASLMHADRYQLSVEQDKPYLLVFTGDWHIGEAGTDHRLLKRDIELLAQYKNQYPDQLHVIAMGDYIGGYMKSKTPSNRDQVLSPSDQRHAAKELLELIQPSLVIEGDHDSWHNKHDNDTDWLAEFCEEHDLNYAQWGAELEILSDSGSYTVLARHRAPGSRRVDPMQPQVKLHQTHGPADCVALAHVHSNPGASYRNTARIKEDEFLAVQSGTYKVRDEYAKKLALGHGEYGVPCVLVIPEMGESLPYQDLKSGLRALEGMALEGIALEGLVVGLK